MSTPAEKAKELVRKFIDYSLKEYETKDHQGYMIYSQVNSAKACAIIAVKETIAFIKAKEGDWSINVFLVQDKYVNQKRP